METPARKAARILIGCPVDYFEHKEEAQEHFDSIWGRFMMVIIILAIAAIFIMALFPVEKARADNVIVVSVASIDMSIIAQIESSGNPKAFNESSGAVGLCQITPIVLKEYNQFNKLGYKMDDLYDGAFNRDVANWYMNQRIPQMLKHFKIKDTVRNRLWAYNAGIGNVKKNRMPEETKSYIVKYERLIN